MKKKLLLLIITTICMIMQVRAQNASIQVVHNAAGEGLDTVDVWINNVLALNDMVYRTATPFRAFPVGGVTEVRIKHANSTDTSNPLYFTTSALLPNRRYIIAAQGDLTGRNDSAGKFKITVYQDALTDAPSGQVKLLFANGASDLGTLDLGIIKSRRRLADNLRYGTFDVNYRTLTQDTLNIALMSPDAVDVRNNGLIDLRNLRDSAYTVYTSGYIFPPSGSFGRGLRLMLVSPSGRVLLYRILTNFASYKQFVNSSSVAGTNRISFWVNGIKMTELAQMKATDFLSGDAGNATLSVTDSAATDVSTALATATFNFNEGRSYVINLTGTAQGSLTSPLELKVLESKLFPSASSTSEFKVISCHREQFDLDYRKSGFDTTSTTRMSYGTISKSLLWQQGSAVNLYLSEIDGSAYRSNFRPTGIILDSAFTFFLLPEVAFNPKKIMVSATGRVVVLNETALQARTLIINNTTASGAVDFYTQLSTRTAASGNDIAERNFVFLQANNISPIRVAASTAADSTLAFLTARTVNPASKATMVVLNGTTDARLTMPNGSAARSISVIQDVKDRFPSQDSALLYLYNGTLDTPEIRVQWDTLPTTSRSETVAYKALSGGVAVPAIATAFRLFTTGTGAREIARYNLPLNTLPKGKRVAYVFTSGSVNPVIGMKAVAIVPDWAIIPLSVDTTSVLTGNTSKVQFSLYPNPSIGGSFRVGLENYGKAFELQISDLQGRALYHQVCNSNSNDILIQPDVKLSAGLYQVSILTANGARGSKALLVK